MQKRSLCDSLLQIVHCISTPCNQCLAYSVWFQNISIPTQRISGNSTGGGGGLKAKFLRRLISNLIKTGISRGIFLKGNRGVWIFPMKQLILHNPKSNSNPLKEL